MEEFNDDLAKFLREFSDQPEMKQHLSLLLRSHQNFSPPDDLIPMDELDQRLSAIERILQNQRDARIDSQWCFTRLQFATLISMPLANLQHPPNIASMWSHLNLMNELFKHFLQKQKIDGESRANTGTETASLQSTPEVPTTSTRDKEIRRNPTERNKCLNHDNHKCVVTGTASPHVCHILPFALNKRESTRRYTQKFTHTLATCFGLEDSPSVASTLGSLSDGLGTSDKVWNMIALTPTLHTWWGECCFAFKWIGVLPADPVRKGVRDVQLQFRWMPRSQVTNGAQLIILDEQKDPSTSMLGDLDHFYGTPKNHCTPDCSCCDETKSRRINDPRTGHPIRSGTIITVTRDDTSIDSFKAIVDLQWALVRAAAISGAALAPELLSGPDDDNDDWFINPIDLWREEVFKSSKEDPSTADD